MAKKPYIISTFSGKKGELPSARLVGSGGGGGGSVTVDAELSATSENPVQNKVINAAISGVRQLPVVSSSDNDKFLRVVSGAWAAATVPSAETASF